MSTIYQRPAVARTLFYCFFAVAFAFLARNPANALDVRVTVTNLGPTDGVAVTPLWVGFHNGSFDSYNGGLATQPGLERLAEDGNTAPISADFLNGLTYVDGGVSTTVASAQPGAQRVDATLASLTGPGPIFPGGSASQVLSIAADGSNQYFSYAAMVIPSNDFFVANGNPMAHDISSLYGGSGTISFLIGAQGTVNDAGTEEEDFTFSAGNGAFAAANLPPGQGGPDQGTSDATTIVQNVAGNPFADFLNQAGANLGPLDFNQYTGGGIARVTITAVPEPTSVGLLLVTASALATRRRGGLLVRTR